MYILLINYNLFLKKEKEYINIQFIHFCAMIIQSTIIFNY